MKCQTRLPGCILLLVVVVPFLLSQTPSPQTGPATEKRFPPLRLPPGFKATLFACDPLVEYASAIALGPRPGTLFVAVDYMTGLGTEIVRRDEVRLIEDTDGDGYADKATVFATGFNSIEGMTFHDGTLYVMHAPFLTAVSDTDGDDRADKRQDLLSGLGLPPEKNPVRLHCANGPIMGHDGWLYLALGDHGANVPRQGKDNLVLQGGGILRCRADGSHVHIFATGLRNIYDVALDADLNVFVRDNENDGGDYMIRVCHSFFGGDHGYPYLYRDRPNEALPPLADLGRGSSAGGACYLETAFPPAYRGNLFFCEWGRSVVNYPLKIAGSTFAPVKESDFAAGADNDPYPFKPTDLVVDRDGSLLVADWADGQRPKRGRARIYRIAAAENAGRIANPSYNIAGASRPLDKSAATKDLLTMLDDASYLRRLEAQSLLEKRDVANVLRERFAKLGVLGRMHAVWLLAHSHRSITELLDIARTDSEPRVQVQALRAAADLADPALGGPAKDAASGAETFAAFAPNSDPRVLLELVLAVGRLRWSQAPAWLQKVLQKPDPALDHAAMQTLRRCGNWPAVLDLLDLPDTNPLRGIALRALAERYEAVVVDGLTARLGKETSLERRRAYADWLTRVYKKPGPHVYWGYRPAPRPPATVSWERTEAIAKTLNDLLAEEDLRLAVLRRMNREKIPARPETLQGYLLQDHTAESVAATLEALRDLSLTDARPILAKLIGDKKHSQANRLQALALFAEGLGKAASTALLDLGAKLEEGPVLAELLRRTDSQSVQAVPPWLIKTLQAKDGEVRAVALEILAGWNHAAAVEVIDKYLADLDPRVRRAAAHAAGKLKRESARQPLLEHARDADLLVRAACLQALLALREPRVVPLAVAALAHPLTQAEALECIRELGGPEHAESLTKLARGSPSATVLPTVIRTLSEWSERPKLDPDSRLALRREIARVQASSGALLSWKLTGPLSALESEAALKLVLSVSPALDLPETKNAWRNLLAGGLEGRWNPGKATAGFWLACTDLEVDDALPVQFLGSSGSPYRVWLNGKLVHQRSNPGAFLLDAERFAAKLDKGGNRLLLELAAQKTPVDFHLRFRRLSSKAEHERFIQAALQRRGNAEMGRKVFFNKDKIGCIQCHRLDNQGENIGPDLTGVGSRFSRTYLVESILEPSRTIAPSYDSWLVELKDGKVLTGVAVDDTPTTLVLADNQGQKHTLAKSAIEERRPHPLSTMPEGFEQRVSVDEFVDLIAFLESQKGKR